MGDGQLDRLTRGIRTSSHIRRTGSVARDGAVAFRRVIGPVILDLPSALAEISAVSERLESSSVTHTPDRLTERAVPQGDIHLYALTRSASGVIEMGHVSHSSHSSHSSGSSHYSHGSHASHTSHASHVSGSHSSHVSSSAPAPVVAGRPDLRIGKVGGVLHGNNVYGSVTHQTVEQAGAQGTKLSWQISVQNDSQAADRIRVRGARSGHGFTVRYLSADGTDVTAGMEAGTFRTPRLTHGEAYRLRVEVEVTSAATTEQALTGEVEAFSVLSPGRTDTVAFVARRG